MTLYEILYLIITAFAAVATFAAVIVALWQTKYASRKKLKIKFCYNTVFNAAIGGNKEYISINITNIGNKRVIIDRWGIKLNKGLIQIFTYGCEQDEYDKLLSVKTPYILEPEEHISFFYAQNLFRGLLMEEINKGSIDKKKKIKFFIEDTTGRQYIVKSEVKVIKYLK